MDYTQRRLEEQVEEISSELFGLLPPNFEFRGVDRKSLYNWLRSRLESAFSTSIHQAIAEERARVVGEIQCEECNGSGEYTTPSDHSPCSHCEGTGVYMESCLNDILSSLEKENTTVI